MAGFDPDVFGGATSAGFDPDVFAGGSAPVASAEPQPQAARQRKDFNLRGEGYDRLKNYSPTDTIAGQVRGAGSIGATLFAPFDYAEDALTKLMTGKGRGNRNEQRRTDMDDALRTFGADPSSTQFKTNKLVAEVGGTAGVGSAAAQLLSRIPGATTQIPAFLQALKTGGMTTGAAPGASRIADMGVRVAGGAVNGALTAGAQNPEDAGTGMLFGGAFPVVAKTLGAAGDAVGSLFRSSSPPNPTKLQTARESIDAGYVIPPNMVQPSFKNQVIESVSGKQATQQIASTKNTEVTERLTRQALGIADDVPLTQGTLESLRKTAGKAYAEVSSLSPQAAADLEALKVARNEATGWFTAYNRSARPDDLKLAKEARALSESLETALEQHAKAAGRIDLIPALRDARKQIAKTYTVGRALNDASGTVDARVFGRLHEKGKPLSDGLDVAGKFASAFPTVAKSPQQIGSPAAHNLKAGLAALMASGGGAGGAAMGLGAVGTGGLGLLAGAVPFVAPPMARSLMFSKGAQQGLLNQGAQAPGLLSSSIDEALPMLYRINPLLAGRLGQ
jgi:hypothetical protein